MNRRRFLLGSLYAPAAALPPIAIPKSWVGLDLAIKGVTAHWIGKGIAIRLSSTTHIETLTFM